jgi:hypothetical protein
VQPRRSDINAAIVAAVENLESDSPATAGDEYLGIERTGGHRYGLFVFS